MVHVPFKGAPPTISNLLGKHVDLAALMYSAALPHVKSGELRFLASSHKNIGTRSSYFERKGVL